MESLKRRNMSMNWPDPSIVARASFALVAAVKYSRLLSEICEFWISNSSDADMARDGLREPRGRVFPEC